MLEYVEDLFAFTADEEGLLVLVNPVNTAGVMGAGLALEFKHRYPSMFGEYKEYCSSDAHFGNFGGTLWIPADDVVVACLATKTDYRKAASLSVIETGLRELAALLRQFSHRKVIVHVPALGCGLGGLRWDSVKPLIEGHLGGLPANIKVKVFLPH